MPIKSTLQPLWRIYAAFLLLVGASIFANLAMAQTNVEDQNIDPRLVEITQVIQSRAARPITVQNGSETPSQDDINLDLLEKMLNAFYSVDPGQIKVAVENFNQGHVDSEGPELDSIPNLFNTYADLLTSGASSSKIHAAVENFTATGNWYLDYWALFVDAHLHANVGERQSALQKAQSALSHIPPKPDAENEPYVTFAKARIVSLIAHLHNLQGNSELALTTSLDYLNLTREDPDLRADVDLINNLIYSYSLSRNHEAQLYLSNQLLEIEKTQTSSVPGLSEMRISEVMNSSGRYREALRFANEAISSATHPVVLRSSKVNKAIALAGLGDVNEARKTARLAGVNLAPSHMLNMETQQRDLYLAFLLAQANDSEYATQLFNRQLDVRAQKFLENNSRDTTAMLAELENSRERQAEREAARERESQLQALTIDRQKKLNRSLTILSVLMGLAALAALLFTRFRGRVMRKLEIKTREAASAEKLKTEFLGMISHELRTPLNGIIGISDFLTNYHQDDDIREKSGIILRSGNELLGVVESLTDMARIDAGQLELVPHDADLGPSLAGVPERWTEQAREKGLIFTHFIDPSISTYHIDEDRLLQCIHILLANAVSFTDSGRVHLHVTPSKTVPNTLSVVVADTGQGMSERVQSRLFKPFMQADTSRKRTHMGTGLSLAIAYAIVEMMGGKLSCVSRQGRGSEFTFEIPLRDAVKAQGLDPAEPREALALPRKDQAVPVSPTLPMPAARPTPVPVSVSIPAAAAPLAPPQKVAITAPILEDPVLARSDTSDRDYVDLMQPSIAGRPGLHAVSDTPSSKVKPDPLKILIVDDIVSNRDVLVLMLEPEGHSFGEACDGLTALSELGRQRYDLVILDIHMAPMDGVETLRRLRGSNKSYANIPVIALTADNAPHTNIECMHAGADLFLTKPVNRDELLRSIDHLTQTETLRVLSQPA